MTPPAGGESRDLILPRNFADRQPNIPTFEEYQRLYRLSLACPFPSPLWTSEMQPFLRLPRFQRLVVRG